MTRLLRTAFLLALPHGGQRTARRNAFASMEADAIAARERAEIAALLSRHPVVNSRTARTTSTTANSLRRVASD